MGYDIAESSWEPEANLNPDCSSGSKPLILEWEAEHRLTSEMYAPETGPDPPPQPDTPDPSDDDTPDDPIRYGQCDGNKCRTNPC